MVELELDQCFDGLVYFIIRGHGTALMIAHTIKGCVIR